LKKQPHNTTLNFGGQEKKERDHSVTVLLKNILHRIFKNALRFRLRFCQISAILFYVFAKKVAPFTQQEMRGQMANKS